MFLVVIAGAQICWIKPIKAEGPICRRAKVDDGTGSKRLLRNRISGMRPAQRQNTGRPGQSGVSKDTAPLGARNAWPGFGLSFEGEL